MPQGAGNLTQREMKFVIGVLSHGRLARAAVEAGYSEASAGAIASETLRKPKVFSFYRRCVKQVADKGDELVRRAYERSVIFHAKCIEAAQQVKDEDEWLFVRQTEVMGGKNPHKKHEHERARERAQRDEKHYAVLAAQADTLLASMIGKLTLKVEGELKHSVAISPELRQHLVELQMGGVALTVPDLTHGRRN